MKGRMNCMRVLLVGMHCRFSHQRAGLGFLANPKLSACHAHPIDEVVLLRASQFLAIPSLGDLGTTCKKTIG